MSYIKKLIVFGLIKYSSPSNSSSDSISSKESSITPPLLKNLYFSDAFSFLAFLEILFLIFNFSLIKLFL